MSHYPLFSDPLQKPEAAQKKKKSKTKVLGKYACPYCLRSFHHLTTQRKHIVSLDKHVMLKHPGKLHQNMKDLLREKNGSQIQKQSKIISEKDLAIREINCLINSSVKSSEDQVDEDMEAIHSLQLSHAI